MKKEKSVSSTIIKPNQNLCQDNVIQTKTLTQENFIKILSQLHTFELISLLKDNIIQLEDALHVRGDILATEQYNHITIFYPILNY